jgi:predicted Holliday junction resolvase-like endonuclease
MIEIIVIIVVLILGLLIGIFLAYAYLRGRLAVQFERWKAEFEERIRREVLERSRAVLKGRIGEQLAPLLPMFKHEPADARFIGSPVDYLVFDGYKEGEPRRIIFLDVKTGKTAALSPVERKLKRVVEQGKVEWETLHTGALEEEAEK